MRVARPLSTWHNTWMAAFVIGLPALLMVLAGLLAAIALGLRARHERTTG